MIWSFRNIGMLYRYSLLFFNLLKFFYSDTCNTAWQSTKDLLVLLAYCSSLSIFVVIVPIGFIR